MGLDNVDLKLVKVMKDHCKVNFKHVGSRLGLSHVAVMKRVNRFIGEGLISIGPLINVDKLGFKLVLLLIEVDSEKSIRDLLNRFKECPRILHIFRIYGEYNLAIIAFAEDERVLSSIMSICMLRASEHIRRSYVIPVSEILFNEFIGLVKVPSEDFNEAPCGIVCTDCNRYVDGKCIGCPSTKHYKGWFKASEK
jgi:DNA-binding Lrp family transcriptional regulator